MRRRLALRKETLAELRADELAHVLGAADAISTPVGTSCVLDVTSAVMECDSYLRPCISHTCTR